MSHVIANMSMSLDGFIADSDDDVMRLFGWYGAGDVVVEHHNPFIPPFHLTETAASIMRTALNEVGAIIGGRRVFDLTHGWGGAHPMGAPVIIVTHREPEDWAFPDAPFTFVTAGVAEAIKRAKEIAGGKAVAIASASIAQQALELGLLDEISVDLVPVLLGKGIPFFTGVTADLEDPTLVADKSVTHLSYKVKRTGITA